MTVVAAVAVAVVAAFGNRSLAMLGSDADVILIPNRQGGNIQISTTIAEISASKNIVSIYVSIQSAIYLVRYSEAIILRSWKKRLASINHE